MNELSNGKSGLKDPSEMKVFISARSDDYPVAEKLAGLITGRNSQVDVQTGQAIRAGDRWYDTLLNTLKTSNVLLAVHLGEDDRGNYDWVYQEAGWFVREEDHSEPVIPLYPGEDPPPALDMYQGYKMTDPESAGEFLTDLYVEGLGGFRGINDQVPYDDIESGAEDLAREFAVGQRTPLVDLLPFEVSLNRDGEPDKVTASVEMMKKVGRIDESSTWETFTQYHRQLPGHGIQDTGAWIQQLETAFKKIQNGEVFSQPTQPLQSAVSQETRYMPIINTAVKRANAVEAVEVYLVEVIEPTQVGGPIFRILALFEQLQVDVLSRLKKWVVDDEPTSDADWEHIEKAANVARSLVNDIHLRAQEVGRGDQGVIRLDGGTLAGLLDYAGTPSLADLQGAAGDAELDRLREALASFDTETGRSWISISSAYGDAVRSVMGEGDADE